MRTFELTVPDPGRPVLVEVPHAGLAIPELLAAQLERAEPEWVLRDSDLYVDRLFEGCVERGASFLVAQASRYVVDLNRAPDDVDGSTVAEGGSPSVPRTRGVVWSVTMDGRPLLRRPLTRAELAERIERFHAPYHAALRAELERLKERHGYAIMLAAHSMPSTGRDSTTGRIVRRADIVPGSHGRTSADPRLVEAVEAHFRAAGLGVVHDVPYRGGWSTKSYGRPRDGVHVLQIEINRDLYVDEGTLRPKADRFEELRGVLLDLVSRVAELHLG